MQRANLEKNFYSGYFPDPIFWFVFLVIFVFYTLISLARDVLPLIV